MIYLNSIIFPDADEEFDFIISERRTCYDSFYPFKILSKNELQRIDFDKITIMYGGNGSGKSTALNVIAEKLGVQRDSIYNKSNFYNDYINLCKVDIEEEIPQNSKIITSDDVFDYMLNIRSMNEEIDKKRDELMDEYLDTKYSMVQMNSLEDYDKLKKMTNCRRKTQSKFIRQNLIDNVRLYSNGESAFRYFTEKITENGLYILDEPENSLSPKMQVELVKFIEESAKHFGCQFIISTHSPFILAIEEAKIYNIDERPVSISNWTELENVQTYYEFFVKHKEKFK